MRALYFIKSQLKVGTIKVVVRSHTSCYSVRNQKDLLEHVIPLFNKYPFLTHKYFEYKCFKEALILCYYSELPKKEKNELIDQIKNKLHYVSITKCQSSIKESYQNSLESINKVSVIMTKSWLVGFVEAKGNFFIAKKGQDRLAHGFGITPVFDRTVLDTIASIFNLKVRKYGTHFSFVSTTKFFTISLIVKYFSNTMKGMKSMEYQMWARSFRKYQIKKKLLTKSDRCMYLFNVQKKMQNLSKKFDKNFRTTTK